MTELRMTSRIVRRCEIMEAASDSMPPAAHERVTPRGESQGAAYKTILEWIGTIDAYDVGHLLYVSGPPGTGKTLFAARASVVVRQNGLPVLFVKAKRVLDELRQFDNPAEIRRWRKLLTTADVLVFDDLGAHRATEYAIEELVAVFDYRSEQRMPTIITSNLGVELADVMGARMADRMRDFKFVKMDGPSQRGQS